MYKEDSKTSRQLIKIYVYKDGCDNVFIYTLNILKSITVWLITDNVANGVSIFRSTIEDPNDDDDGVFLTWCFSRLCSAWVIWGRLMWFTW